MGVVLSLFHEAFPSKPTFSVNDIPDLNGKVFIVTGGNSGIGKETVKVCKHYSQLIITSLSNSQQALLQHNAVVYIATRNEAKSTEVIEQLKTVTGKEAKFLQLDLSDLQSVKEAVRIFTE
jgi:retinol dehydrogenase 12